MAVFELSVLARGLCPAATVRAGCRERQLRAQTYQALLKSDGTDTFFSRLAKKSGDGEFMFTIAGNR
jgi:hypothetical protein